MGVDYAVLLGHRGLTHSLFFAALLGSLLVAAVPRQGRVSGRRVWVYLCLAAVTHGVLDAATNGGLGVAFFAPFDPRRFFWPWRPIEVSPIGVGSFLSARGIAVLKSEAVWIGIPSLLLLAAGRFWRRAPRAR